MITSQTSSALTIRLTIATPPKTIFEAITTRSGYAGWWTSDCDIDCRPGSDSFIRFAKDDKIEEMVFRTLVIRTDEYLEWHCVHNNVFESWIGSTLFFELTEIPGGSSLSFRQASAIPRWSRHPEYESGKSGWEFFLASLKRYCETGKGSPWQ